MAQLSNNGIVRTNNSKLYFGKILGACLSSRPEPSGSGFKPFLRRLRVTEALADSRRQKPMASAEAKVARLIRLKAP